MDNKKTLEGLKLYLWGFMGSGKTSVGKALAKAMGLDFIDLDDLISERESLSIEQIFQKGESYFRNVEAAILREVMGKEAGAVVSTGGGTPCFFGNDELMNETGTTVFIQVSQKTLKSRLNHEQKQRRPLIQELNWVEILKLYNVRKPIYTKAHITINGNKPVFESVHTIMTKLKKIYSDRAG